MIRNLQATRSGVGFGENFHGKGAKVCAVGNSAGVDCEGLVFKRYDGFELNAGKCASLEFHEKNPRILQYMCRLH